MNRALLVVIVGLALAAVGAALLLTGEEVRGKEPDAASDRETKNRTGAPDVATTSAADALRESSKIAPESSPTLAASAPVQADLSSSALVFRGQILDPQRKPVAGAEVAAIRTMAFGGATRFQALSDADGKFAIGVPERAGWNWRIEAKSSGFATSHLTDVPGWLAETDVGPIVLYPAIGVKGHVLDRDGRAIANAKVFVYVVSQPNEDDDEWFTRGDFKPLATTGPDGSYSIAALSPGKVTMGAEAAGYADAVRPGVSLSREKPNDVDFVVAPEERLQGTVVDENGTPIHKARVIARRSNAREAFWRKPTETDPQGKFSLPGLDRSRRELNLQFQKLGYSALWQDGTHLPPDEKYTLRKGAQLVVKSERQGGGAGPAIRAIRFERRNSRSNRWGGWNEVQKSQREIVEPSTWRVTTEQRGSLRLVVTTEGGAQGTSSEFEIPQNSTAPIDVAVTIEPAGSVVGRVVGIDTSAMADVRLELTGDRNWGLLKVATTKEGGAFTFEGVPHGTSTISVRSKEWVGDATKVEVRAGEKTEGIEIVVRKPSKIVGKLTIGDAAPGEVVPISFHLVRMQENNISWQFLGIATANEQGEFEFSPAPSGRVALVPKRKIDPEDGSVRSFERENQHPEYDDQKKASWPHVVDVPPEAQARIDVNLPAPRHSFLHGQVTVNNEARGGLDLWLYATSGGDWHSETTNSEGKFRFRVDAAGEYQLQLWGDGFNEMRTIAIGEGDDRELNLTLASGGVEGMVADLSGQPLVVRARLERQRDKNAKDQEQFWGWWDNPEALTKADGSFSFPEVSAGSYRVLVDDPKKKYATMASAVFTIGPKERYAIPQLRAPLSAPIVVNIKNPDGKPVSGRVVVVAAPNSEPLARKQQSVFVGKNGTARVSGVRPGPVVVKVLPNGPWTAADQTVTLPGTGAETVVNVEVKKKEGAPNANQPDANNIMINEGGMIFGEDGISWDDVDWGDMDFGGGQVIYSSGVGDGGH